MLTHGADTVTVTLRDGRNFTGQVLGEDEPGQMAVVKSKLSIYQL